MHQALQILSDSGALQTLLMAILTVVVIPLIQQGHKSAKTAKVANAYTALDKLAEGVVAKLATEYDLPTGVKHDQALQTIQTQLAKKGITTLDTKDIDVAIEKAYQYFTSLDTKAHAKQVVIDQGNANADEASIKAVSQEAIHNAVEPTEPVTDDSKQDEISRLETAIDKAQAKLTELQGDDSHA